jgi:hypothetical protein
MYFDHFSKKQKKKNCKTAITFAYDVEKKFNISKKLEKNCDLPPVDFLAVCLVWALALGGGDWIGVTTKRSEDHSLLNGDGVGGERPAGPRRIGFLGALDVLDGCDLIRF